MEHRRMAKRLMREVRHLESNRQHIDKFCYTPSVTAEVRIECVDEATQHDFDSCAVRGDLGLQAFADVGQRANIARKAIGHADYAPARG